MTSFSNLELFNMEFTYLFKTILDLIIKDTFYFYAKSNSTDNNNILSILVVEYM